MASGHGESLTANSKPSRSRNGSRRLAHSASGKTPFAVPVPEHGSVLNRIRSLVTVSLLESKPRLNRGMFTSNRQDWATPLDLFQKLDAEFHFDLDVCATAENAKCRKFYSPRDNGLRQLWRGTCWLNPPYGRGNGGLPRAFPHGHRLVA